MGSAIMQSSMRKTSVFMPLPVDVKTQADSSPHLLGGFQARRNPVSLFVFRRKDQR